MQYNYGDISDIAMLYNSLLPPQRRRQVYHYRVVKNKAQNIGNVLLPPGILKDLADTLNAPLLFRISKDKKVTHCGVLEFTAKPGTVSMPEWIMNNLGVSETDLVEITNVVLSPATFIKLQPQSKDFLEIYDPKAVLEKSLRSYSAVTRGEIILIRYNEKNYMLKVLEIEPLDIKNAVSIIEADVNVEFAPPVGYVEPTPPPSHKNFSQNEDPSDLDPSQVVDSDDDEDKPKPNEFKPFTGQGSKISGKPLTSNIALGSNIPEEKKPYLIKGQIQYLTQSELDSIKKQPITTSTQNTTNQNTQHNNNKAPQPQSHQQQQQPSKQLQQPSQNNNNKPAEADSKQPTYFTGKGYSLK